MPAEQVIDIGRAAHMQCLTEERDRATILWRKDGLVLASSNRISLNQQTLQIYNLQREDYGVYQCFVTRGNKEVQATAQLRLGGDLAQLLRNRNEISPHRRRPLPRVRVHRADPPARPPGLSQV